MPLLVNAVSCTVLSGKMICALTTCAVMAIVAVMRKKLRAIQVKRRMSDSSGAWVLGSGAQSINGSTDY